MYVCVCNAITEADIRREAVKGVRNFDALRACTGCSNCCGSCEATARALLDDALAQQRFPLQLVTSAVA